MKVVALLGSPRSNGSSALLARHFIDKAQQLGAEIVVHELNALTWRGCQGCYACKTTRDECVLNDGLTGVLADVAAADLLLLATPVFFGDVTTQVKGFVDRSFSYFKPDFRTSATPSRLAPGKKLVFIQTQGHPDPAFFADVFPRHSGFLARNNFTTARLIRAVGATDPQDVAGNRELLQEVESVAEELLGDRQ
ncbi:flavodoxin family protein [Geomesophilobacter sediminis]|uniref:Flavodoxin family protein n=1 Tax=Geomesophilobacter sediminis TaxID=2798584 RepID=A0A8J7J6G1_9BACT|nr:flavodoxin family protein [Geomesophilobacter sediminis]MBJ6724376.1 flavodoxin family protein [Geomesophilobacter sediminis]